MNTVYGQSERERETGEKGIRRPCFELPNVYTHIHTSVIDGSHSQTKNTWQHGNGHTGMKCAINY